MQLQNLNSINAKLNTLKWIVSLYNLKPGVKEGLDQIKNSFKEFYYKTRKSIEISVNKDSFSGVRNSKSIPSETSTCSEKKIIQFQKFTKTNLAIVRIYEYIKISSDTNNMEDSYSGLEEDETSTTEKRINEDRNEMFENSVLKMSKNTKIKPFKHLKKAKNSLNNQRINKNRLKINNSYNLDKDRKLQLLKAFKVNSNLFTKSGEVDKRKTKQLAKVLLSEDTGTDQHINNTTESGMNLQDTVQLDQTIQIANTSRKLLENETKVESQAPARQISYLTGKSLHEYRFSSSEELVAEIHKFKKDIYQTCVSSKIQ